MTERLLQFIWQFQYFSKSELRTVAGEGLHILQQGAYNTNQGPDFADAHIRIDSTLWVGMVELHLKPGDWDKHGHQHDKNYDNVILHVVWENDGWKNEIPMLELKDRVSKILLDRYDGLMQAVSFIPCNHAIQTIPDIIWKSWNERLLAERLLRKTASVNVALTQSKFHWEETFWVWLARNFGMKVNAEAFEAVAVSLPAKLLSKHKNNLLQIEALLLGQAGLLDGRHHESYPILLQREYRFLRKKYKLSRKHLAPLFLRMRPGNFPGIRLAQLAMLIHNSAYLFERIKEANHLKELIDWLDVRASSYWDDHYKIGACSSAKKKNLGKNMIDNIIINAIVPMLFLYGLHHDQEVYKDKAIRWLEQTKAENNSILRGFQELGVHPRNASESQSLLELKNQYCNAKRCLECSIGNYLLKRS